MSRRAPAARRQSGLHLSDDRNFLIENPSLAAGVFFLAVSRFAAYWMGVTIEACDWFEMTTLSESVLLIVAPSLSMMLPMA